MKCPSCNETEVGEGQKCPSCAAAAVIAYYKAEAEEWNANVQHGRAARPMPTKVE